MTSLKDLAPPSTRAVMAATAVARRYASPWLFNHAQRSYWWGAGYAALRELAHDSELYYVAAILHDLGLEEPFDSHRLPFEEAGGHLAWVLTAAADWPTRRRDRAAEIIVRHMHEKVSATQDPESHLLQVATSLDISGRDVDLWPVELRQQVLEAAPRGPLTMEFMARIRSQAERKPDSAAAVAWRCGLADRAATNPLDMVTLG